MPVAALIFIPYQNKKSVWPASVNQILTPNTCQSLPSNTLQTLILKKTSS